LFFLLFLSGNFADFGVILAIPVGCFSPEPACGVQEFIWALLLYQILKQVQDDVSVRLILPD
jgi:hypothetical protein